MSNLVFNKVFLRLILLMGFVIAIGVAKFILIWGINIKAHSEIFFNYNSNSKEWYSFLFSILFWVIEIAFLISFIGFGWFFYSFYSTYLTEYLPEYKPAFFLLLPFFTFWLLNSNFIYNYVAIYSSIDSEGLKSTPVVKEYPNEIFPKADIFKIEQRVEELESDEEFEDEVSKRGFLFLETGLINGFKSNNSQTHGLIDYLCCLGWALIEYMFVSILYLFTPILIYEIYTLKAKRNEKE